MSSVNDNNKIESPSDSDGEMETNETIDESQLDELEQKVFFAFFLRFRLKL